MSEKLNVEIDFSDGIFKEIKRLQDDVERLAGKFDDLDETVTAGFKDIEDSVERTGKNVNRSLGQINFMAITENVRNFRQTLESVNEPGLEFESQMADLEAITGIAGEELEKLGEVARRVGVDEGMGAAQGVETFKLLASNIDVAKIGMEGLIDLQQRTITLSQTSRDISLPMAANIMAGTINQFQFDASQADRVINTLAAGAKKGAAELPDLAMSLKNTGTTAALAGVSLEETVGALEVLSQNSLKGAEAGTGLRNVITLIQTQLGVNLKENSLTSVLKSLQPQLNDTTALAKIFGRENLDVAQALIANADNVDEMTKSVTATNTAYEQAAIQTGTYAHELEKIHAWFDDIKISVFNATGPMLPFTEVLFGVVEGAASIAPIFSGAHDAFLLFSKGGKLAAVTTNVLKFAQLGLNAAFVASPIGWVVTGIGALVGAVYLAWEHFEEFRGAIYGIWEAAKVVFGNIADFFIRMIQPFIDVIGFISEGKWGDAAISLAKGIANMATVPLQFGVAVAKGEIVNADVMDAAEKGYDEGVAEFRKEKDKKTQEDELTGQAWSPDALSNIPATSLPSSEGGGKSKGLAGIASDVGKSVTLAIENLIIDTNIYPSSMDEGAEATADKMAQAIMASLRDVEAAV